MGIYIQKVPIEQYRQTEPQRLDRVSQDELMSLLVLPVGMGDVACRLAVIADSLHLDDAGNQRFGLKYTDPDLRVVTKKLHLASLVDRYWSPDHRLPLQNQQVQAEATTGYFLPYDSGIDDEWTVENALRDLEQPLDLVDAR